MARIRSNDANGNRYGGGEMKRGLGATALRRTSTSVGVLVFCLLSAVASAGTGAASRPASAPAPIPEAELARLGKFFDIDFSRQDATRQEIVLSQMQSFIANSLILEAQYPHAPNLYILRLGILRANGIIFREKKDLPSRRAMVAAAQGVLDSPAPAIAKVYPDRVVTAERLQPLGGKPAADPEGILRQFAARYAGTPAAAQGLIEAYRLAQQAGQAALAAEFVATLEARHADGAGVFRFLTEIGRRPLFRAALTRLEGGPLVLPDDVKGKIVVVEFWATWEPACAANQPLMRKVRSRYGPKGVEVVGISLDAAGRTEELKQYVRDAGLGWTQTYSGQFKDDATALRCGVTSVPSVWVLDRKGRAAWVGRAGNLVSKLDELLAEAP